MVDELPPYYSVLPSTQPVTSSGPLPGTNEMRGGAEIAKLIARFVVWYTKRWAPNEDNSITDAEAGKLSEFIKSELNHNGLNGYLFELRAYTFTDPTGETITRPQGPGLTMIGSGLSPEDALTRSIQQGSFTSRPSHGGVYNDDESFFIWAERQADGSVKGTTLRNPRWLYKQVRTKLLNRLNNAPNLAAIYGERSNQLDVMSQNAAKLAQSQILKEELAALQKARDAASTAALAAQTALESAAERSNKAEMYGRIASLFSISKGVLSVASSIAAEQSTTDPTAGQTPKSVDSTETLKIQAIKLQDEMKQTDIILLQRIRSLMPHAPAPVDVPRPL